LERQAEAAGAWEEAVGAYEAAADLAGPERSGALLRRAAQLLEAPLGRLQDAIAVWRRLLERAPDDAEAAAAVESLLARTGAHAELIAGWERQLEAADAGERRGLLDKMAGAIEAAGGDPAAAVGVYERILEIEPDEAATLGKLIAALSALERW